MSETLTTGQIAARFGVTRRQVQYAAEKGGVEPADLEREWNRLYDAAGVEQIRQTLLETVDLEALDAPALIALHAPEHAQIADALYHGVKLIMGSRQRPAISGNLPDFDAWYEKLQEQIVYAREGMKPNLDRLLADENTPDVLNDVLSTVGRIVSEKLQS